MKKFKIAIVGNGIIGTLLAYSLRGEKNICIIGPSKRSGSASAAAGAMLNVFGEVDYDKSTDNYLEKKIKIGVKSQILWKKFANLEQLESYGQNCLLRNSDSLIKRR